MDLSQPGPLCVSVLAPPTHAYYLAICTHKLWLRVRDKSPQRDESGDEEFPDGPTSSQKILTAYAEPQKHPSAQ